MDDRGLATAIVSGDPDGLAEALDRFGASLLAACRAALPADAFGPDAAGEVVLDIFLIARSRLDELADPGKLGAWLHAVARSECLRRAREAGVLPLAAVDSAATADSTFVSFPQRLRGQIMAACADDTPAGRDTRATISHRAGPFGRDAFPEPADAPHRGRRLTAGAAAIMGLGAAVLAAAVVVAVLSLHHGPPVKQAAVSAATTGATTPAPVSVSPSPASPAPRISRPAARPPSPGAAASLQAATSPGQPSPSVPASPPAPRRTPAPPKPSKSPRPTPPPGTLVASTQYISVTSVNDKPVAYSFVLTAQGGPVPNFTVSVSNGLVTAQPDAGSLPPGGSATITVTAHAKASFTTTIHVSPGGLSIELRVIAKTVKTA